MEKLLYQLIKNHSSLVAKGVGSGLSTKINVNLGISKDCPDVDKELEKVKVAIDMKADAIMDLSSFGKTEEFRKKINCYVNSYGWNSSCL